MNEVLVEHGGLDFRAFAFIISLAAVINGLGIVRWLVGFAEYFRIGDSLKVEHYWVFNVAATFQFLLHILLWWTIWSIRESSAINFLTYLYLLTGPVLLYLGTSLLTPETKDNPIDLRAHFFRARRPYATILILLWVWAIFSSPVFRGHFAPTLPLLILFLVAAVALRISTNPRVLAIAAVLNWLVFVAFVALYATNLDAVG